MRPSAVLVLLALCAGSALCEVRPVPDRSDPRMASLRSVAGEPARLDVPVGREVTVLLPTGETLSSVNVAAPGDWQVDARGGGEAFVIRPVRPVPDSTMTVQTTAQSYSFILAAAPGGSPPMLVRIIGDGRQKTATSAAPRAIAPAAPVWKLSGNKELWPSSIRDDGAKTYLEWPADRALPAVFALDRLGREEMVNGYMRGTIFTIDRVHERLLFRIDKASAEARRRGAEKAR